MNYKKISYINIITRHILLIFEIKQQIRKIVSTISIYINNILNTYKIIIYYTLKIIIKILL